MITIERTQSGDILGHGNSTQLPDVALMLRLCIHAWEQPKAGKGEIYRLYQRYLDLMGTSDDYRTGPQHWSQLTERDGEYLAEILERLSASLPVGWRTQSLSRDRIEAFRDAYHRWRGLGKR